MIDGHTLGQLPVFICRTIYTPITTRSKDGGQTFVSFPLPPRCCLDFMHKHVEATFRNDVEYSSKGTSRGGVLVHVSVVLIPRIYIRYTNTLALRYRYCEEATDGLN